MKRSEALRYRVAAQGLHRNPTDPANPADLPVMDLGLQYVSTPGLRQALAARLPGPVPSVDWDAFVLVWTVRGAPHLHRRVDLPRLAGELWPVGDADAIARLGMERKPYEAAGIGGVEAFGAVSDALRAVVDRPTAKGDASAGVTAKLPDAYSYDCTACRAFHVYTGIFMNAAPFAGLRIVPDVQPLTLTPVEDFTYAPTGPASLLRTYLRLHGPATMADAAGFLGTTATAVRDHWPADVVEVDLEGRRTLLPADAEVDDLPSADDVVRLLPPHDPFLQGRDRAFLVPDRQRQKAIWRPLGNPGVVLAGGEIVGVWRAKAGRKGGVQVTVEPFEVLKPKVRKAVEAEAEVIRVSRGADTLDLRWA